MQKLNQCSTLSKMWLSYVLNMCAILLLWTTWIPIINWVCWAQTLSEGNHGPQKDKRAQKVHEYVKKKMDNWEAQVAPCMEKITWGWHPMFHIFNIVSFLWTILLKFPWTHNKAKVSTIVTSIYNMQKVIVLWPTAWVAIILKMFMFAQGFRVPTCHPIKGGTQQNILKWMGLGFNFGL